VMWLQLRRASAWLRRRPQSRRTRATYAYTDAHAAGSALPAAESVVPAKGVASAVRRLNGPLKYAAAWCGEPPLRLTAA
jgi:hypothetical protein